MSLKKWVEYGWLRREATSPGEIKDLPGIVERGLADSQVEAVSPDLRFIAAFGFSGWPWVPRLFSLCRFR